MALPSLLLVPGAWHSDKHFQPLINELESIYGFECFTVNLPSMEDPDSVTTIDTDTNKVRAAALQIIDGPISTNNEASRDLVVVMHSYGGVPGSNALGKLRKEERIEQGKKGGVIGVAYMAAFLTDEGHSVATTLTGDAQDWMNVPWKAVEGRRTWPKAPAETFYHDLPGDEAQTWVSKLKPQALETNLTPTKYAAWKHYPVAYLVTQNDNALPHFVQEMVLDKARKAGTVVLEDKIDTGHSPFLKDPKATAEFLHGFVERL